MTEVIEKPVTSGKTVIVGCKLPNGIHLDLREHGKPLKRVSLRGANAANVIGGYGITENVPEDFINRWLEVNSEHPAVVNGLIFAQKNFASAKSEAHEKRELKHGIEPLDPQKPGKDIAPSGTEDDE